MTGPGAWAHGSWAQPGSRARDSELSVMASLVSGHLAGPQSRQQRSMCCLQVSVRVCQSLAECVHVPTVTVTCTAAGGRDSLAVMVTRRTTVRVSLAGGGRMIRVNSGALSRYY